MNGLGFIRLFHHLMIVSIAVIIKMFTVTVTEYAVYTIAHIRSASCKSKKMLWIVMIKPYFPSN